MDHLIQVQLEEFQLKVYNSDVRLVFAEYKIIYKGDDGAVEFLIIKK